MVWKEELDLGQIKYCVIARKARSNKGIVVADFKKCMA